MKKFLLSTCCLLTLIQVQAQVITDTVSIGANYANQVWYSLQDDEQGASPKNNWDLAFEIESFGTSIHINSVTGTMLWTYPHGDTSSWNTMDTIGISGWVSQYNSDTSWSVGAFDIGADPGNMYDIGWGIYNSLTHIITGDSLFIIKLASGDYKKLWILNLAGGGFNFKYANLDGSNLQSVFLPKSTYVGKNFGYYSLQSNMALDREPVVSSNWDLLFTQYTGFIPSAYNVVGVLLNKGVSAVKVGGIGDAPTNNNWQSYTFNTEINEIGYNWKAFTGGNWVIEDSLLYFVQPDSGVIWKMIFTGFGGSALGDFVFNKEKLSTITSEDSESPVSAVAVYPNPSNGKEISLVLSCRHKGQNMQVRIFDLSGKIHNTFDLLADEGLQTLPISTAGISPGIYIVSIQCGAQTINHKIIIN